MNAEKQRLQKNKECKKDWTLLDCHVAEKQWAGWEKARAKMVSHCLARQCPRCQHTDAMHSFSAFDRGIAIEGEVKVCLISLYGWLSLILYDTRSKEFTVFPAYRTTIYCQQSQKVLEQIMEDGINWYLSLNPTVFPIERTSSQVVLKAQKSYRSNGELITISVQPNSFKIVSRSLEESARLVAWGKNRENVFSVSACLKSQVSEPLFLAA